MEKKEFQKFFYDTLRELGFKRRSLSFHYLDVNELIRVVIDLSHSSWSKEYRVGWGYQFPFLVEQGFSTWRNKLHIDRGTLSFVSERIPNGLEYPLFEEEEQKEYRAYLLHVVKKRMIEPAEKGILAFREKVLLPGNALTTLYLSGFETARYLGLTDLEDYYFGGGGDPLSPDIQATVPMAPGLFRREKNPKDHWARVRWEEELIHRMEMEAHHHGYQKRHATEWFLPLQEGIEHTVILEPFFLDRQAIVTTRVDFVTKEAREVLQKAVWPHRFSWWDDQGKQKKKLTCARQEIFSGTPEEITALLNASWMEARMFSLNHFLEECREIRRDSLYTVVDDDGLNPYVRKRPYEIIHYAPLIS